MKIVKTNTDYKLTEVGEFIKNKTKKSTKKDSVNFFPLEIMESGEIYLTKNKKVDDSIKSDLTIVEKNNILYGKCRPLLNKAIIAPTNGLTTGEVLVYETNFTNFFIHLFHSKKFLNHNVSNSSGSKMPRTSNEIVKSFKFNFISESHMIKTGNIIHENYIKLENIKELIKKIEVRNQYYADKLLSGELTIENNIIVTSNNNQKNKTIKITDHIDIINGYPFKSSEMKNEGKYAVIKMSNFKETKVSTLKNTVYTNNLVNKAQLIKNDLLIGLSGSVGEYAIFNLKEICLLNQRCIILRNKNDDIGDYVKTYIINKILEDLKNSGEGGVIKNVSSNFFHDMEIILPTKYKEIMLFINKINEEKEKVEKLLKLEEQRFEWLSDKLLSGEYIIED